MNENKEIKLIEPKISIALIVLLFQLLLFLIKLFKNFLNNYLLSFYF
jgi:hypothetical protein